jgi:tripartite-type tricarboxylate transporter receptor subunit TctC
MRRRAFLTALCFAASLSPPDVKAQAWPERPVTFVVSQAAGAAPDVFARIVAERLSRVLGKQVIVDNRPGGANVIGAQSVARAAPDGYTFFFATSAALTLNPFTFKNLSYDPVRDFEPVALMVKSALAIVVSSQVPAKNLKELIALEKSAPGKMSIAVDGPRIIAQYVNKHGGTQFTLVPYTNITTALQDTVAGRVESTVQAPAVAEPFIAEGSVRAIALSGSRRYGSLPDVQTISETLPGFEMTGWFMLMAPAKTPAPIIERLNTEIAQIMKDPDVRAQATRLGFEIETSGIGAPKEAAAFLKSELAIWGKTVQDLGIEPQ